jgi:hypothetical protein
MLKRIRNRRLTQRAADISELARELAQDKRFRKRVLSAVEHGSEAGRRTGRALNPMGAVNRIARDPELLSELRRARRDVQAAYRRLEKKRRTHRLRNSVLVVGVASAAGLPWLRKWLSEDSTPDSTSRPARLEDLTRDELYARAQDADIPGRSEMSKSQLIDALRRQ